MIKIGIVGLGYVGNAVAAAYNNKADLVCVDTDPAKSTHNFNDLFATDAIFVCVPSPANLDGSCDGSILTDTLNKLSEYKKLIISKTTALPSIYESLSRFQNLVHIPEFLTAANSIGDYANETSSIIGGSTEEFLNEAIKITRIGQRKLLSGYICSLKEAAFAKYVENCFLATKVVFMNQMALLAQADNIPWTTIAGVLQKDPRVGLSHCSVPGSDGKLGFGGHCFPKDTSAFINYAKSLGIEPSLLELAVDVNKKLRNENN